MGLGPGLVIGYGMALLMAVAWYFVLFAPRELRRALWRRQTPRDHHWIPAVVLVAAMAWFLQTMYQLDLGYCACGVAAVLIIARGGTMRWLRRGCPFAAEPEPATMEGETRLRIAHLLGLAVCVALYFGVVRGLRLWLFGMVGVGGPEGLLAAQQAWEGLNDLLSAMGLAGLVLWGMRWWRGRPFPVHPGEYLWALSGIQALEDLPQLAWMVVGQRGWLDTLGINSNTFSLIIQLMAAVVVAAWIWVFVRLSSRRWRIAFAVVIVGHLVPVVPSLLVMFLGTSAMSVNWLQNVFYLLLLANVVVVVPLYLDHREGVRRRWSHGVGVLLWLGYPVLAALAWGLRIWTG